MNRIFFILSLLLTIASLKAQDKVIECSGKKPNWARDLTELNYLVMQGDASSLTEAQQKSLLLVKQEIVRSIAEQVISSSTRLLQEKQREVSESYTQNISAKANKVPYVQGISLAQIESFYWEKIQDKSTQNIFFRYYIKYPFGVEQLTKLVAEFRAEDKKITQRINTLEFELEQVETLEQIDAAIDEIGDLIRYVEDFRKVRANSLLGRYRTLFESVDITELENKLGEVTYQLMIGDRAVSTIRKPIIKNGCATILQTTLRTITYSYDGCYSDIENFIELHYRLGNRLLRHKFLIPLK
ncbi:MAG: hypothetical protein ACRC9X_03360 [Bacteroidales bacterium]